jgi:C4-dicarboxylate-specific signal transduction histidine kinase
MVISVSDTGTGMDAANQTRASEPFFTTKRFGSSRALGLSMVYGFAKQSGSRDAVAALSVTLVNVTYRRWIGVSICASLGCGASWS